MRVLPKIETTIKHRLAFKLGITFSHLSKIVNEFEKKGWVKKNKVGRIWDYELTSKGFKISRLCDELIDEVEKSGKN